MNVLFDKAAFEKNQNIKSGDSNELKEGEQTEEEGKVIKDTIFNSIQFNSKLGALTVDPSYLHFRALDRKFIML